MTVDTISSCDSYLWRGKNLINSGIFYDTTNTSSGCDSIYQLDLRINYSSNAMITVNACDTFIAPSGKILTSSGSFKDTIRNSNGCDSIIFISLQNNESNHFIDTIVACDTYTWMQNGNRYDSSGFYSDSLLNQHLCDSIVSLDLTIKNSSSTSLLINTCDSYLSPSGKVLSSSGSYKDTINNSIGCDSVILINLIVNSSNHYTDTVLACNSYNWTHNGLTYTSSGLYCDSLVNQNQCDSIVCLDLTVDYSPNKTDTVKTCEAYTWKQNGKEYQVSGIYSDTVPSPQRCDSILYIDLTVDSINTKTTRRGFTLASDDIGGNFQWLDCNDNYSQVLSKTSQIFTAESKGRYAVEIRKYHCVDTSNCVPVPEITFEDNSCIFSFPNPTKGEFEIAINPNLFTTEKELWIYNSKGKIVLKAELANNSKILDLSTFADGVYIIEYSNCREKIILSK
jgi:hypothetical protein